MSPPADSTTTESTGTNAAAVGGAATRPAAARLPDLLYGEAETELRAAVRALLADRCSWPEVLARTESPQAYDTGLWQVLAAELGCAGLLIPEGSGGAGASYREAAVVAEETGRAVAPVPFLGSAVVATAALLAAGDDELLAAVADGASTAALAVPFAAVPGARPEPSPRRRAATRATGSPGPSPGSRTRCPLMSCWFPPTAYRTGCTPCGPPTSR
jgi:alkylation response protein AidB-like acyl-CoA dehydrogenase